MTVSAYAPGRVNLIGDHTDYMGGLVLPMAVQLGTTVTGDRSVGAGRRSGHRGVGEHSADHRHPEPPPRLVLRSDRLDGTVEVVLPATDPAAASPTWGRYAAGVAAELGTTRGFSGTVTSDLPIGGGLSSSASLSVAVAAALGGPTDPTSMAQLCRRAETAATGVPCGIMDQLAVTAAVEGHALLIDCSTLRWDHVRVPDDVAIWVVDSGSARELAASGYSARRAESEAAAAIVGALPTATPAEIDAIADPVLRARARHVRSECDRVLAFADALVSGDLAEAGRLMLDSHRSLRDDHEVSTPDLDALVERLAATPGVHGARLTGAGFGGWVVVLSEPDAVVEGGIRLRPSAGATVLEWDGGDDHLGACIPPTAMAARDRLPTKPDGVVIVSSGSPDVPAVRIRPATRADAAELHAISCGRPVQRMGRRIGRYDPEELVWRYMPVGPFDGPAAFESLVTSMLDSPDRTMFVVEDPLDGSLVGSLSLIDNRPADLSVEIGAIWCTPALQGAGVVTAACRLMVDHLFALGYLRVEWKCHAANARSRATARRLGFRFEGVQEQRSIQKGRRRDTAWFRLLRAEWQDR